MARTKKLSEYDLGGTEETGIYPKGPDALSPGERMRLTYLTGVPDDPAAPIDEALFHGVEAAEDRTKFFTPQLPEEGDPESDVEVP